MDCCSTSRRGLLEVTRYPEKAVSTMQEAPIFIVGVPRSGTTLLSSLLGAHSRLSCGPETQVFAQLPIRSMALRRQLLQDWPNNAVRALARIEHVGGNVADYYGISSDELAEWLRQQPASLSAVFGAIPEVFRRKCGAARWVEKTPNHLSRVATIRQVFPQARIIRIVRDPRAVAVSLQRVPWGPSDYHAALGLWWKFDSISEAFFASDRWATTVRYEDLLRAPEDSLRGLCDFIGEDYESRMIDNAASGRLVNASNEPWKAKAAEAVDASRTDAWKRDLGHEERRFSEAALGDRLADFGYERSFEFAHFVDVEPSRQGVFIRDFGVADFVDCGCRFWRRSGDEPSLVKLILADLSLWVRGSTYAERMASAAAALVHLGWLRLGVSKPRKLGLLAESGLRASSAAEKLVRPLLAEVLASSLDRGGLRGLGVSSDPSPRGN